jgi:hypothetical protein
MVCNTITHVTHLVGLLHTGSTSGNPNRKEPLPSVDNIAVIAELGTPEDAIMMAQDEIACLDNMSLEGDLPDNISDKGENREEALFTAS